MKNITAIIFLGLSLFFTAHSAHANDLDGRVKKIMTKVWGKHIVVRASSLVLTDSVKTRIEQKSDQAFSGPFLLFWTVTRQDSLLGYAAMDAITLRSQQPLVLTVFDAGAAVLRVQIFKFHGMYGRGATTQNWLKHFIGKQPESDFSYANGVPAVSGATESAHGIRKAVKRLSWVTRWVMQSSQTQNAGI